MSDSNFHIEDLKGSEFSNKGYKQNFLNTLETRDKQNTPNQNNYSNKQTLDQMLIEKDQIIFNTIKELREKDKLNEILNKKIKKLEEVIINNKSKQETFQNFTFKLQQEIEQKNNLLKDLNSNIEIQNKERNNLIEAYEDKLSEMHKANESLNNQNKTLLLELKKNEKASIKLKENINEYKGSQNQMETSVDDLKKEIKNLKQANKKVKEQEMLISFLKQELKKSKESFEEAIFAEQNKLKDIQKVKEIISFTAPKEKTRNMNSINKDIETNIKQESISISNDHGIINKMNQDLNNLLNFIEELDIKLQSEGLEEILNHNSSRNNIEIKDYKYN